MCLRKTDDIFDLFSSNISRVDGVFWSVFGFLGSNAIEMELNNIHNTSV